MMDEKKNLLHRLVDLIPDKEEKVEELPALKQFEFEWFDLIYLPIGLLLIAGVLWVLFRMGVLSKTKHDGQPSWTRKDRMDEGDPTILFLLILMGVLCVSLVCFLIIHFTKELITFVFGVEL